MSLSQRLADFGLRVYQKYITKEFNARRHSTCMYSQSCSSFAREAYQAEGVEGGTRATLARLARCTEPVREQVSREFDELLAATPRDRLNQAFVLETPEARALLEGVKTGTASVKELEVVVNERYGQPSSTRFEVRVADHDHEPPPVQGVVQPFVGLVVGVAGGLMGALGGALAGAAGGAVLGWTAGSGKLDETHQKIAAAYGSDTVTGMGAFEHPVITTLDRLSQHLPRLLGGVVGGVAGFSAGLGVGLLGGASAGWGLGRALGHGLAREHLRET